MKSTQIFSMFMSLSETEEARLCGGNSLAISNGVYEDKVFKVNGSLGKAGVKKQTVQSTTQSTTKVVKITKGGKIPQGVPSDLLSFLQILNLF